MREAADITAAYHLMKTTEIIYFDETDSTQTRAKELLKVHKKTPPFCVVAGTQTGGYGQAGRHYYCPQGGLYMTLVLPGQMFEYKFAAGFVVVSLMEIIKPLLQESAAYAPESESQLTIKWINDIMLDGKKVCGVLVEKTGGFFLIGIGINLAQTEPVPDYLKEKMGFLDIVPSGELVNRIIEKIISEKLTDEQVIAKYKTHCNINGLNIDGSLDVFADGKIIRKFNNL